MKKKITHVIGKHSASILYFLLALKLTILLMSYLTMLTPHSSLKTQIKFIKD